MRILIIVDPQDGFVKDDFGRQVRENIIKLSNSKKFNLIIVSKFINSKDSLYSKYIGWNEMISKKEHKVFDGLFYDEILVKRKYSFIDGKFINKIKKIKQPEIYLCGFDTDACVFKIALDLFDYGIAPIILKDYCYSSGGKKNHEMGLKLLKRTIGSKQVV